MPLIIETNKPAELLEHIKQSFVKLNDSRKDRVVWRVHDKENYFQRSSNDSDVIAQDHKFHWQVEENRLKFKFIHQEIYSPKDYNSYYIGVVGILMQKHRTEFSRLCIYFDKEEFDIEREQEPEFFFSKK